jgi:hypothetical protein
MKELIEILNIIPLSYLSLSLNEDFNFKEIDKYSGNFERLKKIRISTDNDNFI